MSSIKPLRKEEATPSNQAILSDLEKSLGFVPHLYSTIANSDTGLAAYLGYQKQNGGGISAKEREAIQLVVSQVNGCRYCQSAHTMLGKMNGFSDEQILALRAGHSDDARLDALVKFAKELVEQRGHVGAATRDALFAAGYTAGQLVDIILIVSGKIVANYLHNVAQFAIDFPVAPELETVEA
jgi:uncharacterized peroxidase-related enzyme